MRHETSGIPVEGFEPSREGPPRAREAHPFGWREGTYAGAPRLESRMVSYHPVTLPPIKLADRSRVGGWVATALLGLALLVVAGVVVTLVFQYGWLGLVSHSHTSPGASRGVTTAASSTCPRVSTYTLATPARLDQVDLTTGLRDSAEHDYRPIDNVASFIAGERGYVTFRIATNQTGNISIRFCLPSRMVLGTLAVPADSEGRFGEFEVDFTRSDIGHGEAILYWGALEDGVSAIVHFTVRAT